MNSCWIYHRFVQLKFKFIITKKVLFSAVAITALSLASCGKSADDVMKDYCECLKSAGNDPTKVTECATKAAEDAKDVKDWDASKLENACK